MAPTDQQAQIDKGLSRISEMLTLSRAYRATTTAVALGIFDLLAKGPASAQHVAETIHTNPRATLILLDALVSLEFLAKTGETYINLPIAQHYLVSDSPHGVAANLYYQELLAPAWAALPQVVRQGKPQLDLGDLLADNPVFTRQYIRGMADISRRPAAELAENLRLGSMRKMLDVGGGPGVFIEAVLAKAPGARAVLLDLPPTLALADTLLAGSPVRANIELKPGNYHEADFGQSEFDLVLMSHITHDEGESENQRLLKKAFTALRSGGQAVIHDFMLAPDRTTPLFGALFSLHMLVYTPKGRTYSAEEYGSWMLSCGFTDLRQVDICPQRPTATKALIGIKP